jgi:predicted glycogen debranching enzyme
MITIPRDICVDLDRALDKEWLVTNGIGGFASGTVAGVNTRHYHGLLIAALKPPVERTLLLASINEEAEIDERTYYLGANEYRDGKIHPAGFVHIEEFRVECGIPTTDLRLGDTILHKTIWMEYGHNTSYVRYSYVEGEAECCLVLHPMCNYRDYHGVTRGAFDWDFGVEPVEGGCKVTAHKEARPFWLTTTPTAEFTHTGVWYWNFVYRREVERGFEGKEDLYLPGVIRLMLQPGESITLVASVEPPEATGPLLEGAFERERSRQQKVLKAAGFKRADWEAEASTPSDSASAFAAQLALAADTFMVTRKVESQGETTEVPTVIAGYPWFTDWGRDTMISLPGLALPLGRTRQANQVLRTFGLFSREGLIPNNFPDSGSAPQYNTADATLWMFQAVEALATGTGNMKTARDLYPLLADMVAWHVRGTRHGIRMDPEDGLLAAGEAGVQLTWMDAKVDGWVVTPRTGKPVEINALWYNALRVMDKLRRSLGRTVVAGREEPPDFQALAEQVHASFRKRFWYDAGDYLFDVIDGPDGPDTSLRPNQIFAVSLHSDLLSVDQARRVLAAVREHLLTPYGLRTLAPDDPQYKGTYTGTPRERDAAYHNGTVWTWLLGPYFDAVRAIEGADAARKELEEMLPTWREHLADAGLGSISEIFDGDPPHTPRGCISQAWSVAEVLRHIWGPGKL